MYFQPAHCLLKYRLHIGNTSPLGELVLTLSYISFSDNYNKQVNSVAIGSKMGPS